MQETSSKTSGVCVTAVRYAHKPDSPKMSVVAYCLVVHRYIPSAEKKQAGAKKQCDIVIHRKKPHPSHAGQTLSIPYRITDNPLRLSQQEWYNVLSMLAHIRYCFVFSFSLSLSLSLS